jgi:anti-sigma factor RsiW
MTTEACGRYESLLIRLADGTIDAAARRELDAHLATCADCREAVDAQRAAREALVGWLPGPVSPEFAVRTMAEIERRQRVPWQALLDFRRWTWRLVPVAASLAILAYGLAPAGSDAGGAVTVTDQRPVSAALWAEDLSEADVLALMIRADADDALAQSLERITP